LVTAADAGGAPLVIVRSDTNQDGITDTITASFLAYTPAFQGGVRVATGDFDGDNRDELVTAAGPGGGPHVILWDLDVNGALTGAFDSFYAFDPNFTGGAWVATGDFNLDGRDELIVAADAGGGPHVRIFSDTNGDGRVSDNPVDSFYAFDPTFTGGTRVAVARLGDRDRLVVAAGPGGRPQVKLYPNLNLDRRVSDEPAPVQFDAFDPNFTGGVFVAANRTGRLAAVGLVVSAGAGGGPHVRIFGSTDLLFLGGSSTQVIAPLSRDSFFAYDPGFSGGVRATVSDLDPTDGNPDVVTAPGPGGRSLVKVWSGDAGNAVVSNQPLDDAFATFRAPDSTPLDIGVFIAFGIT
jgi:hypothetical protein